jgi:hypothetical protein
MAPADSTTSLDALIEWACPSSYLYPVMDQANLTVLTGAYVSRLTIEDQAVTGVAFEWQGQLKYCQPFPPQIPSPAARFSCLLRAWGCSI